MPKCRRFIACYNIILYCRIYMYLRYFCHCRAPLCVLVRNKLCFIFPLVAFSLSLSLPPSPFGCVARLCVLLTSKQNEKKAKHTTAATTTTNTHNIQEKKSNIKSCCWILSSSIPRKSVYEEFDQIHRLHTKCITRTNNEPNRCHAESNRITTSAQFNSVSL